MTRDELQNKLNELNVYSWHYSLDGELFPDCLVRYQNYSKWEVFYFDERGKRDIERIFTSEFSANEYILEYFKRQKEIERKFRENE